MKKKILMLALCLGLAIALHAQTNFTGSYKLKDVQHISGPEYGNAVAKVLQVKQTADSVSIGSFTLALNGTKRVFTNVGEEKRKMVRSLTWSADKKTLKVTTAIYMPGNDTEIDLTREDTYSMAGSELVLQRKSIESNSESWETKGIYIREVN